MANNNERSLQYRIFLLMTIFVFSIAIQSLTITNGNNAFANKNDDIVVQAKPLPSLPVETGKLMYVVNIDDNSVSVINTDVIYVPRSFNGCRR